MNINSKRSNHDRAGAIVFLSLIVGSSCLALRSTNGGRMSAAAPSQYFTKDFKIPPLTSNNDKYGSSIPVCYTNSPHSVSSWFEKYIPQEGTTIGFDVESNPNAPWVNVKFHGPATVQMAVPEAAIVVHLVNDQGHPSDASTTVLQSLLADKSVIKAGVGIDQDMLELYREWGCNCDIQGRLDMGSIGSERAGSTVSLKRLADAVLGVEMVKNKKLAVSEWGKVPLTEKQIAYAARDAWAAAAIISELQSRDEDCFSTPALRALLKDELDVTELDQRAVDRKGVKTRLTEILGKKDDRILFSDLNEDLQKEVRVLEKSMRELAPPRAFVFDIEALGMSV